MGEAATGLSSEFRQQNAEVPWTKIIALRNRLIHVYFDVDFDIVWDTIQERLRPLIPELEAIVSRMQ
ncbi:MAG: HepT-like ribonuclease domain-containing protein [Armatimonadia bacterium]